MLKRRIACVCLAVLLLLSMVLSGCSNKTAEKRTLAYSADFDPFERAFGTDADGVLVTENEDYQLYWSEVSQCAFIYDVANDKYFGTTPFEYYWEQPDNVIADYEMYNPILVSYIKTNEETSVSNIDYLTASEDCIDNGDIVSELLENGNGIRITYYFSEVEIAIPLELELTERGLLARIPVEKIQENGNLVYEIGLLPYMASAAIPTDGSNDSYLMVPTGGGALIDVKALNEPKSYSEALYGADKSEPLTMLKQIYGQSYLPIFGAKNGDTGVLGIIGDGAACALVNATNGNTEVGYSTVYASFRVRGKEEIMYNNSQSNQENVSTIYSEDIANYENLTVEYIPLVEDSSYVGMANTYRQTLIDDGYLQNTPESVPALSVNLLGSTRTPESFFGIPYKADTATTTIEATKDITDDLKGLVGDEQLLITLVGYGEGGLSNTVVGGNFKLSGKVGSQGEMSSYLSYAKGENVMVAMNYELAQFQKTGAGFSAENDVAYRISGLDASFADYVLNTAVEEEDEDVWYLLARGKLVKALQKAIKANKKMGFEGIALGSLSNTAYSDYRKGEYAAKSQMENNVEDAYQQCADSGYKIVASEANLYAALNADYITEVPMSSSKYTVLSREIPMYALVFQGYKSLSSTSINLTTNVKDTYLKAVATGMTLQFTLYDTPHDSVKFDSDTAFISGQYSKWEKDIEGMYESNTCFGDKKGANLGSYYSYEDLHSQVGNQAIVSYEMKGNVSKTVFANGVTVYVNYNDGGELLEETDKGQINGMTEAQVQELFPEYALGDIAENSFVYQ